MARAVCSSAPLSGAAPFLRTCRLGWRLVCHVSAVSRGRSPGNCFPQLGPQLFVITGKAVTSRSRSSLILMGWWSAQCNDFTKVMIAAGRARQHHQQCKGVAQREGSSFRPGWLHRVFGRLSPSSWTTMRAAVQSQRDQLKILSLMW
jgi:hypothetical protein